MNITLTSNRYGHLEVKQQSNPANDLYIQVDYLIEEFLGDLKTSSAQRKDINAGWTVTKRVNDETWDNWRALQQARRL